MHDPMMSFFIATGLVGLEKRFGTGLKLCLQVPFLLFLMVATFSLKIRVRVGEGVGIAQRYPHTYHNHNFKIQIHEKRIGNIEFIQARL